MIWYSYTTYHLRTLLPELEQILKKAESLFVGEASKIPAEIQALYEELENFSQELRVSDHHSSLGIQCCRLNTELSFVHLSLRTQPERHRDLEVQWDSWQSKVKSALQVTMDTCDKNIAEEDRLLERQRLCNYFSICHDASLPPPRSGARPRFSEPRDKHGNILPWYYG